MSLDSHLLSTASAAVRGYVHDLRTETRDEALPALGALIDTARSEGDEWAETRLRHARDLVARPSITNATEASRLVDEVMMRL